MFFVIRIAPLTVSILDTHVKDRYAQRGWPSLYGNNFQASTQQLQETVSLLDMYGYKYECCAEKELASMSDKITEVCIFNFSTRSTFNAFNPPVIMISFKMTIACWHMLNILFQKAQQKEILLLCFCPDETLCHRSIVLGLIQGV